MTTTEETASGSRGAAGTVAGKPRGGDTVNGTSGVSSVAAGQLGTGERGPMESAMIGVRVRGAEASNGLSRKREADDQQQGEDEGERESMITFGRGEGVLSRPAVGERPAFPKKQKRGRSWGIEPTRADLEDKECNGESTGREKDYESKIKGRKRRKLIASTEDSHRGCLGSVGKTERKHSNG